MDETLHQLGRILLNAVPTFFIVLFLIAYLRFVFFGPVGDVLKKRYEETEGAQKAAEESMRQAERRVAEYEEKLRAARHEIYTAQDKAFRQMEGECAAQLEQAKREADAGVSRALGEIRAEADEAGRILEARSGALADTIVDRVLAGRAA